VPNIAPQQGTNQLNVTYELEVPAKRTVAVVHVVAVRGSADEAMAFMQRASDKEILQDLPADLLGAVLNFAHAERVFGDLDILRGTVLDVVELRGGDQYRGTIKEDRYKLQTFFGPVELSAERVVAVLNVG